MGTIYFGPYHEEIDTYSHEGYAVRVMPDGREISGFGGEYGFTGHVGYRSRCECGWSGSTVWPVPDPDPMESAEADEQWMREHITPMVEYARRVVWPQWQKLISARAETVGRHMAAYRYQDAVKLLSAMREDLDARLRTVGELAEAAARAGEPR